MNIFSYVRKQKALGENQDIINCKPHYQTRLVFTIEQEATLAEYLKTCAKMCYGKTTRNTRELAYEMATLNGIIVPQSWHKNKSAGLDWMRGFFNRNKTLSIRQPENCSLSRMTSFTRPNVELFFNNLEEVLNRFGKELNGSRIFNLDETATSTVPSKSVKVIAQKGARTVSNAASAERGVLVTTTCIISASGNSIPPAMVFPRVKFRDHMLMNAVPGTLGLASPSGWMSADLFPSVMQHFIKYSLSSKDNPTVLIMDNHASHMSIEAIDMAKNNGVTIITLPPHCSNKLQPLDVTCFASFKKFYATAVDNWMKNNPGKTFSFYEIAGCVRFAHQKAMTPENITKGFERCGIFPFNKHIFTEEDFLCNFVTDRPQENNINRDEADPDRSLSEPHENNEIDCHEAGPSQPQENNENNCDEAGSSIQASDPMPKKFITPEQIKCYPKAPPRQKNANPRKRGRSMIPTDTPEKTLIENKANEKKIKEKKKEIKNKKIKRKVFDEDGESEPDEPHYTSDSSSEVSLFNEDSLPMEFQDIEVVNTGDYVLVEFQDRKKIYFVGKVTKVADGDIEVSYCRKSSKMLDAFVFPLVEDIAQVDIKDIKLILPPPIKQNGTKRACSFLRFSINFTGLDVR